MDLGQHLYYVREYYTYYHTNASKEKRVTKQIAYTSLVEATETARRLYKKRFNNCLSTWTVFESVWNGRSGTIKRNKEEYEIDIDIF